MLNMNCYISSPIQRASISIVSPVRTSVLTLRSFKQCSLLVRKIHVKDQMIAHLLSFLVSPSATLISSLTISFVSTYNLTFNSAKILIALCSILPCDNEDALVAILTLGHFFQYDAAQADARVALEQLNTLRPSRKLVLGFRTGISQWVEEAFRSLVALPFVELAWNQDVEPMGLHAYHAVVSTRFAIDAH